MSDLLYIPQLAAKLGMTEAAVRNHIARRTEAIPPWFNRGKRIAWRTETVEKWLIEQERAAMRDRVTVARVPRRASAGTHLSRDPSDTLNKPTPDRTRGSKVSQR